MFRLKCTNNTGCGRFFRGPKTAHICPRCWADMVPVEQVKAHIASVALRNRIRRIFSAN